MRRRSITYAGYAIGCRGGHVRVRIDLPRYREIKPWRAEVATRRNAEWLAKACHGLAFEPYFRVGPVRRRIDRAGGVNGRR